MTANVLVMAQGEQRRLANLGHPKHLIEVCGETILGRTLRLARAHLPEAVCHVIGLPAHQAVCRSHGAELHTLAAPGTCILDGIIGSSSWWNRPGRSIVLLGDVVFSRAAMASVIADQRPLVFAGTTDVSASTGELFAASWTDHQDTGELLRTAPCRVRPRSGERLCYPRQQGGHLRRLLWWAQDRRRLKLPAPQLTWAPELYLPIDDWTDDIDTQADLAELPKLELHAMSEDC